MYMSNRMRLFQCEDRIMIDKDRKYSRLFVKVYVNYAVMVIIFAIILGAIFMQMIQKSTTENYRNKLVEQARSISNRLNLFIIDDDYKDSLIIMEMMYNVFGEDMVWTISNPNASRPMAEALVNVELDNGQVSEDHLRVMNEVFAGNEAYTTTYSEIHGSNFLVIGVPVYGINREVCGGVLINSPITDQMNTVQSSMQLIITSALIALIISFIIAIIFARQLTKPISKMRLTALELAEGKYETKTDIERKDEIGDLAKTIDFLRDKLIENEKMRKNLEQMRLDFFANVSHELRTPITVVRAYTESLVDGVVTAEEKRLQYYHKMLSECKSMERLVGDLLILSKMQNPDFEIEAEPVNLLQIFDEIIRAVNIIGKEKNIQIELIKDKDSYMMFGDYDRLRQMFLVILDNAVKFSPENSTIHMSITEAEEILIVIRDEGIGIAKEELPSIFEKFYKSKLRQNAKGSGLGLAIAKQIALKHGGDILVQSEIGVGTEFSFIFQKISDEVLEQIKQEGFI